MSFSCGGTEVKPPKCGFIIRQPKKNAEERFHNTTTPKKTPKSGFIIRQPKNHRSAVVYVSTGLACLPRDAMSTHHYRRNYNSCFIQPLFGGRLLLLDRPQVGKPTWGYDYTTALRRLPSPSPSKTAEERLYMLARGWLAYPVTSTHSQLPPKSGCINTQKPTFSRLEVPQKQSFRLRNRSRKLFRFGF